jgi:peptidyl-prolyl cis-trans isomerase C
MRPVRSFIHFGCALFACAAHAEPSTRVEPKETVLVSYANGAITQPDVESVIAQRLPAQRKRIAAPGGVAALVDSMLRWDLLVEEARARGYEHNVLVQDAARRRAVEQVVAHQIVIDPKQISAADLQRASEQHRREFTRPYMRRATHLQVATKSEADTVEAQLKHASREEFTEYVRQHSLDVGTRGQGGELGYFDKDGNTDQGPVVPPQLTAAVFALKQVGDITAPIAMPNGFSILMFTGELKAFATPPAEQDERLRELLVPELQKTALEAWVGQLSAEYKPVVHPELIDKIVLPAPEPPGIPEGFPAAPPDPREPPKLVEPDKY